MRPVVAEGEELARALDTALPMLAVAGAEKSALEGFISTVVSQVNCTYEEPSESWVIC